MASPCSVACSLLLIPPSFLRCTATERPVLGQPEWMVLRWQSHADGKNALYPELVGRKARARLVVLAGEIGGGWSTETSTFVGLLAKAKARSEPSVMRRRVEQAWRLRWGALLACAFARAFAASLLDLRTCGADGAIPHAHEVVHDFRFSGLAD